MKESAITDIDRTTLSAKLFSEISPIYEWWVKSEFYRKTFDKLYARWNKIAQGKKSPGNRILWSRW